MADAKARLSEIIERVETVETIDITNRGKLIARVVPAEKPGKPFDFAALKRLTDSLPIQEGSAGDFVSRMRVEDRY